MSTKERGRFGEDFAAKRLLESGYEILARNWRFGRSEIDLIARKSEIVAFVEVKLRCLGGFTSPAGSVSRPQMRRIVLAAADYLKKTGLYDAEKVQPRFDIFEITVRGPGSLEIVDYFHMEHAYNLEGLGVFL